MQEIVAYFCALLDTQSEKLSPDVKRHDVISWNSQFSGGFFPNRESIL